ncbi:MAG: DUF2442 domain-containing protein [Lentisphaerae bacterium]|mgnify:CR=1 FL=1|jgi:hypothetical protein|nr:DUF2442 domain-containing protein [Lentisphaerota bacterium]MBT4818571.1 DUF2442 domain-containing protein [Lentisphaerota bacterium]MBT5609354.1 DUF2442 domain-containing protein [Lentisphaerota bacterium]MBT7057236.1 DUF2442 domain-containing protein [Lentisphaerota bacterium]MBT7843519.1 DUF2442 domain-containing protein [Lentisphaerota bacterium]
MDRAHDVHNVTVSGTILHLEVDAKSYAIDLTEVSGRLAHASQAQLERIDVSPSGYGLYWPAVDEDLSIDGLIGVKHASPLVGAEV